jgi:molecular chaperone DnaK
VTPFDLLGVFMVGGTSLLHGVAPTVRTMFPNKDVRCDNPFEAVARGACRYAGEDFDPTLVHDYCLRGWNRDRKAFELVPVIEKGTKYPTPAGRPACAKYMSTACSGAPTLGLVIHERSEMIRPEGRWIQGSNGRMQYMEEGECSVDNVRELNPDDKEFIHAVPLCEEDQKHRFVAGFAVDEHKRLTLSLKDTLEGNKSYVLTRNGERIELPLRDFPMVRL